MRDLFILVAHRPTSIATLLGPGGARAVVAESRLMKQQLLICFKSQYETGSIAMSERLCSCRSMGSIWHSWASRPDTWRPGQTEGNGRWHPNRAGAAVNSGMGRRRSMADDLIDLPWWFAVCLAVLVFGVLRHLVPIIQSDNPATLALVSTASLLAPFPTVALLAIAALSALKAYRRRRLVARQTSLESIRALPWRTFEHLVSEAFRQQGYTVAENIVAGADGGVDLKLRKGGETTLVQCKHWKASSVSV